MKKEFEKLNFYLLTINGALIVKDEVDKVFELYLIGCRVCTRMSMDIRVHIGRNPRSQLKNKQERLVVQPRTVVGHDSREIAQNA